MTPVASLASTRDPLHVRSEEAVPDGGDIYLSIFGVWVAGKAAISGNESHPVYP